MLFCQSRGTRFEKWKGDEKSAIFKLKTNGAKQIKKVWLSFEGLVLFGINRSLRLEVLQTESVFERNRLILLIYFTIQGGSTEKKGDIILDTS